MTNLALDVNVHLRHLLAKIDVYIFTRRETDKTWCQTVKPVTSQQSHQTLSENCMVPAKNISVENFCEIIRKWVSILVIQLSYDLWVPRDQKISQEKSERERKENVTCVDPLMLQMYLFKSIRCSWSLVLLNSSLRFTLSPVATKFLGINFNLEKSNS